jgi:hypothetical protein
VSLPILSAVPVSVTVSPTKPACGLKSAITGAGGMNSKLVALVAVPSLA